jgi:hypothetical protein
MGKVNKKRNPHLYGKKKIALSGAEVGSIVDGLHTPRISSRRGKVS